MGLDGLTLSFLDLPLESGGKKWGSQDEAMGEGLLPRAHGRSQNNLAPGVQGGRGLLYWQVARCHSRRLPPGLALAMGPIYRATEFTPRTVPISLPQVNSRRQECTHFDEQREALEEESDLPRVYMEASSKRIYSG